MLYNAYFTLQATAIFRACMLLGFLASLSQGAEVSVRWRFGVRHEKLSLKCGDTLRFIWNDGMSHDLVEVPASSHPGLYVQKVQKVRVTHP